jgi:hypothetical protein
MNAMDAKEFTLIQQKGIKEIEIKASMYEASAHYHQRKSQITGVLRDVSKRSEHLFLHHDMMCPMTRCAWL